CGSTPVLPTMHVSCRCPLSRWSTLPRGRAEFRAPEPLDKPCYDASSQVRALAAGLTNLAGGARGPGRGPGRGAAGPFLARDAPHATAPGSGFRPPDLARRTRLGAETESPLRSPGVPRDPHPDPSSSDPSRVPSDRPRALLGRPPRGRERGRRLRVLPDRDD